MMKLLLTVSLILPVAASAQEDGPEAAEAAPTAEGATSVGGRGLQTGDRDHVNGGAKSDGSAGGEAGEGASAPCAKEDLNWNPGGGGPATATPGQAMRLQPADTTIAYRVRAGQLGDSGRVGIYTDSHPGTFMSLTNQACALAFKRSGCEADYGSASINYLGAAALKAAGSKLRATSGQYCPLPAPAGKIGGENYWWLNVHTKGPCEGGRTWFGGQKTPDGQCARAITYTGGGSTSTAPPPAAGSPAAPKPNTCWKAPSGRRCCDVMFSPVPSECVRR